MKTLAVILHYNTPQYTDVLYEMLVSEQESGNYELAVIDNGSDQGKSSKYTTHKLEENIFFGGALNASMEMVLESNEYDSLLFLNSDLIVGHNFIKSLRSAAGFLPKMSQESVMAAGVSKSNLFSLVSYDVLSPCIIQPEKTQNHWKQMIPWGNSECRTVRWIDLQAPLISKRFIQHFNDTKTTDNCIDTLLLRGWGIDVLFGIVCETQGWKTGVCDYTPAVHLGSMTMKALGNVSEYCRLAEQGMYEFFNKKGLINEFIDMRRWAENYKI